MGKNTGIVKEKRIDLISLFKSFLSEDEKEIPEEEIILNDETLSESDKKELIKSLKHIEKTANERFNEPVKVKTKKAPKIQNKNSKEIKIEKSINIELKEDKER